MLIIKAYVNDRQIDELWIQNVGEWFNDYYKYKVIKPEGVKRKFIHSRSRGWKDLVQQVLNHLITLEEADAENIVTKK